VRAIVFGPVSSKLQDPADDDAIARLAGGVAHEFNNLLTVIGGHAELLLEVLPADHPARVSAVAVRKAARAGELVANQLLAISRRQVLRSTPFDLNDAVWSVVQRLAATLPADVSVTVGLTPGLPAVEGDRQQLDRAIANLVANARDAMPRGGMISIATAMVPTPAGSAAQITVSDNGCGMSADVRRRIFEPFFSTQPFGKGAGLGLATARGIVEQSGGVIEIESEPGRGTTVAVSLPFAMAELEGTEPPAVQPGSRPLSAIRLRAAASS
jgi:signal transduction histidine kinase